MISKCHMIVPRPNAIADQAQEKEEMERKKKEEEVGCPKHTSNPSRDLDIHPNL